MSKSKKNGLTKANVNKKDLKQTVEKFLAQHPGETYPLKKLFSQLELKTHPVRMLCVEALNEMLDDGTITRTYEGEVLYNKNIHLAEGIFTCTAHGRTAVELSDGTYIFIYEEDTMHAMPGDRVMVSVHAQRRGTNKMRGQVIEIITRSEKPIVGTMQIEHGVAFLVSPSGNLPHDVFIPADKVHGAENGQKVLVRVTDWPRNSRNPFGEVIDVLGNVGENDTEMHAILAEFGLPYRYPQQVEEAANKIDAGITAEEIAKREDFRDTLTFTIDPRDAKDFDDAISIKEIKKGQGNSRLWEVGVHIADVSHYVTEGSVIDREAESRATSVYLVDRTIPMLPEHLCNGICSLRPDEEKLTYSVIFNMNENAEVLDYRIRHTVIKSNRRYTYEEVQRVLEDHNEATECEAIREGRCLPTEPIKAAEVDENTVQPEAETYADELITLNRLAKILRSKRVNNGALEFDREEVRFEIDEKGKPVRVYFKQAKDANKLVEEFMLLANRTVAESVGMVKKGGKKAKVLPYRIHDLPDPNKLDNLAAMAARIGYMLRTQGTKVEVADSINGLLDRVKDTAVQNLIETVSIRAMQKAKYSTDNIGHYGLAFDYYTHFTSPIRRYPDLMVHRLLTMYETTDKSASKEKYEALCEHSSAMEVVASNAERASIKYKQVEFMQDKVGEEFDAKISGVTEQGLFAEITENRCEGFIPVRFLGDEGFHYDDRNFCLVGRETRHTFTLGDPIRIKVVSANLYRKQLDFEFVRKLTPDGTVNTAFYRSFVDLNSKGISGKYAKTKGKAGAKKGKKKDSRKGKKR